MSRLQESSGLTLYFYSRLCSEATPELVGKPFELPLGYTRQQIMATHLYPNSPEAAQAIREINAVRCGGRDAGDEIA